MCRQRLLFDLANLLLRFLRNPKYRSRSELCASQGLIPLLLEYDCMRQRTAFSSILPISILLLLFLTASCFALRTRISLPSGLITGSNQGNLNTKYWYVGAYSFDNITFANEGVRSQIQVRNQQVSSFLAFWISDSMSNNLWGQVGYYFFHDSGPTAFYQIWNLTTRTEVGSGASQLEAGIHDFTMALLSNNIWAFSVDSALIGTYNMHTNVSSSEDCVSALSEEGYSYAFFQFQPVLFEKAIEVLHSGTWLAPQFAASYGDSWGMQGENQNVTLSENEFVTGGASPSISFGTVLWG